jgi:hypothetical protein
MFRERHIVDDRVFLLGLDKLYRTAIMPHEQEELLYCARVVSEELGLSPFEGPVEGYYLETPELTEYFKLMRALKSAEESLRSRIWRLSEFQRLEEVASSPLFGRPEDLGYLLPVGCDPLSQALSDSIPPNWGVEALVRRAHRVAIETDDYSLVGLAARVHDPVVLTAARESVVLYAWDVLGALRPPKYVWAVDKDLARQAGRFVDTFNSLLNEDLPAPKPKHAEQYWQASEDNEVIGRCVRLGMDDSQRPTQHYHWAIAPGEGWPRRDRGVLGPRAMDHRPLQGKAWMEKLLTLTLLFATAEHNRIMQGKQAIVADGEARRNLLEVPGVRLPHDPQQNRSPFYC